VVEVCPADLSASFHLGTPTLEATVRSAGNSVSRILESVDIVSKPFYHTKRTSEHYADFAGIRVLPTDLRHAGILDQERSCRVCERPPKIDPTVNVMEPGSILCR
jgi:hypothetical protein